MGKKTKFLFLAFLTIQGCAYKHIDKKEDAGGDKKPRWATSPPTHPRFDYYVGRAYGIKDKRNAIEAANVDARFQIIQERFGIKTTIQRKSVETIKNIEYRKSMVEGEGKAYLLKGLIQQDAFFNGDTAWVLVKILKPNKARQALWEGVRNSNMKRVKWALDKGAKINQQDGAGETPLHIAARNGKLRIVKLLESKGADLNMKNNNQCLAAHLASENYHYDVVEYLISKGTNANTLCSKQTLFVWLASMNRHEIVSKLILKGIDINFPDGNGKTPLFVAIEKGHPKMIALFLKTGANPNVTNKFGETPLHIAVKNGHKNIVAQILTNKRTELNAQNKNGETPLHYAASKGLKDIIKLLLDNGATPVIRDENGRTPASFATDRGHRKTAIFLVKKSCAMGFEEYCQNSNSKKRRNITPEIKENFFQGGGIRELDIDF